jgi:hypothetical protein
MAITRNITQADPEVIVEKGIASAAAIIIAAAGNGAGGKLEASENEENCKSSRGVAQH